MLAGGAFEPTIINLIGRQGNGVLRSGILKAEGRGTREGKVPAKALLNPEGTSPLEGLAQQLEVGVIPRPFPRHRDPPPPLTYAPHPMLLAFFRALPPPLLFA